MTIKDQLRSLNLQTFEVRRGEIWALKDVKVLFPGRTIGRVPDGKERYVLILQNNRDNNRPNFETVTVLPITTRLDLRTGQCFPVKAGEGKLSQDSLVKAGFIQPVLKVDLDRKIGSVSDQVLEDIDSLVAANLGLIEDEL